VLVSGSVWRRWVHADKRGITRIVGLVMFCFGAGGRTPSYYTIVIRKSVKSVNPYKIGIPGIIRMKRITRING